MFETQLFNAGVPYRVYGGLRFFERAEVKHALAYLRLLENPRDDTSFLRVVNFPPRGIGARTLEQLQDAARAVGTSLHDAVSAVSGKAGANLGAFVAKIDVLREQTAGQTLREIIEAMLESSGLIEHYRADREGADRIENLEELASAAESFVTQEGFGRDAVALPVDETAGLTQSPVSQGLDPEGPMLDAPLPLTPALSPAGRGSQRPGAADLPPLPLAGEGRGEGDLPLPPLGEGRDGGRATPPTAPDPATGETLSPLAAFLTHAALEAGDNQAQAGQDAVQLMTVHASKGLEFDAVFITGLEEGLFPHENAMSDMDGLEEERRLMYVAITRARKRLYLSHAQTRMLHGQTRYHIRSRFLEELPEDALKWITPRRSGFADIGASVSGAAGARPAWGTSALDSSFAAAPLPPRKAAPSHGIAAGQQVFHNKFGEGKVLAVEGAGDDARAQVSFPRHGVKWLALAVAKLTVVD